MIICINYIINYIIKSYNISTPILLPYAPWCWTGHVFLSFLETVPWSIWERNNRNVNAPNYGRNVQN